MRLSDACRATCTDSITRSFVVCQWWTTDFFCLAGVRRSPAVFLFVRASVGRPPYARIRRNKRPPPSVVMGASPEPPTEAVPKGADAPRRTTAPTTRPHGTRQRRATTTAPTRTPNKKLVLLLYLSWRQPTQQNTFFVWCMYAPIRRTHQRPRSHLGAHAPAPHYRHAFAVWRMLRPWRTRERSLSRICAPFAVYCLLNLLLM